MNEFASLLSGSPIGPEAMLLSERLVQALSKSRLNPWNIADAIAHSGRRALIGVAPYSMYDLRLLDALNALPQNPESDRIDVFDVLALRTADDAAKYIPNRGRLYETPLVGIWKNGVLQQKESGYKARKLIMNLYGIAEKQAQLGRT